MLRAKAGLSCGSSQASGLLPVVPKAVSLASIRSGFKELRIATHSSGVLATTETSQEHATAWVESPQLWALWFKQKEGRSFEVFLLEAVHTPDPQEPCPQGRNHQA